MRRMGIFIAILLAIIVVSVVFFINRDRDTTMNSDPFSGSPIPTNPIDNPTPTISMSPIPDEWDSYTSAKYGFMIKLPKEVTQSTTSEGERFFKAGATQSMGTELYDGISVIINSGSLNGDDFKTFVDKQYASSSNDQTQPRMGELESITLGGKTGYSYTVSSLGDFTYTYLPKGNAEYLLIINGTVEPSNTNQQHKKIVDTMLSSLVYE